MWSLGGFFYGSTVMIWALFSPIAASLFMDRGKAFLWFGAYFGLLLISGAMHNILTETIIPIPEVARVIFFILNLGAGSAGLYLLVSYTTNQEKLAIARLNQKQKKLEAQSEGLRIANEQLVEARTDADEANRAKSEFLANMSHEIRTPLNAVLGMARIGLRETGEHKVRERFERILDSGQHLLRVINDILDLSKIEAGMLVIESHPFQLSACVEDTVGMVSEQADTMGLLLSLSLDKVLPAWVQGDSLRLQQILLNLLSNAIKFTPEGEVSLSVKADGHMTRFQVTDSGIGMSQEEVKRLFTPFAQADTSTTRQYGGTGLGLAICHNLANLMGGDINAESRPEIGSVFTLSLPLPMTEPVVGKDIETHKQSGPQLKDLRILATDDMEMNRIILEALLEYEGAHVIFAENGQQAIDRLEEQMSSGFDVVLMDIQMPVMDGCEATRRIRKMEPGLPIIGLTAHALAEEREKCLAAGMVDHVTKPIDPDILIAAILRHIEMPSTVPNDSVRHEA
jgi:signal transduction histidine kinase/ActR/RegA family two-component response regulator